MKILGLDLGVASIGWALIKIDNDNTPKELLGLGSRTIPFESDTVSTDFSKGKGETPCTERTRKRQMRRQLDRYQQRREQLKNYLREIGLIADVTSFEPLNPYEIWKLRSDASTPGNKLAPKDIARVILHLNQRRGYKHAKSDMGDSKQTEYVAKVNDRYNTIHELGMTAGQYFFDCLKKSENIHTNGKNYYCYRIKEKVLPRKAYEEELETILNIQSEFYPQILTDEVKRNIHHILFFQRPLKSCKHLVSFCESERKLFKNKQGKTVDSGPKVAPRSSPLAQVCKLYEAINNITLINEGNKKFEESQPSLFDEIYASKDLKLRQYQYNFDDEERQRVFDYLNTHDKITESTLLKELGLKKSDGFKSDKALGKGLQGNTTRCKIAKALEGIENTEELLRFELHFDEEADTTTGEILTVVNPDYQDQPLYQLWHTLYSIDDKDELFKNLRKKFGIEEEEILERLYALDFTKAGYANKSAKFMRKLIPYLMKGMKYSEACEQWDINHSNSITKEENDNRELKLRLEQLQKGELRQPIVEKILNQTINLVNAVIDKYGPIDEVRVELARELRQNKEQRDKTSSNIAKNERENNALAEEIKKLGILPTRRRIQKMKMLKETGGKCIYCGKPVTNYQFIEGHGYEIEHIIPRSRLFDDSFSNKVCACRECNAEKGATTAYDYMQGQSEEKFNTYCQRVDELFKSGQISKAKRDKLMMSAKDIPDDFIERDLRLTQYITKKTMDILKDVVRNVYASSGSVTDFFRHAWEYDTILQTLNLPKYEAAGLTENVEYEHHGQKHTAPRIKDWTKRKDHRHHAIDALVVALTRQGYIQRLNTLNARGEDSQKDGMHQNLDKWAAVQPHFDYNKVADKVDEIAVSFKSGKRTNTPGKRYIKRNGKRICVQTGIQVPRGALHKETVYGKIKVYDGYKDLKYALNNLPLVKDQSLQLELEESLKENGNDVKKTLQFLKKNPILRHGESVDKVECYRTEVVVRYPIESIDKKDINSIVDPHIRNLIEERYSQVANQKDFQKSLAENQIYSDAACTQQIKHVRCFTGIKASSLATVSKDVNGEGIGYASTRNNHHVAFYRLPDGKYDAKVVSFWECVKRKKYGIPYIISDPDCAWERLSMLDSQADIDELSMNMPTIGSELVMTLQRNKMFILGMTDDEYNDAVKSKDWKTLTKHLYRVWKLSLGQYCFKFHTDTKASIEDGDKEMKQFLMISSVGSLLSLNPRKVRIDILGNIIPLND